MFAIPLLPNSDHLLDKLLLSEYVALINTSTIMYDTHTLVS